MNIRKIVGKLNDKYYIAKAKYIYYFKTLKINEKVILLESQHAKDINGNIFYIIKELATNKEFKDYEIFLSYRKGSFKKLSGILEQYELSNVKMVEISTEKYFKLLASAKFLINDNTFLPFFMKKEGQIYLNTWHGTPLKTLGRKIKSDLNNIGNAQKNFVDADYILCPNEYTMKHLTEDYMINNLSQAKILLTGYPRNTIFFNERRRKTLRKIFELEDKKVYMYMPTWRGKASKIDNSASVYLQYYLHEIDKKLKDDEIMYVNLHPIAKKDIDFRQFKNIKAFDNKYETYDFLNMADCLITDYSSVFYDFAVTGRKIVLFTFDEQEYFRDRGTYASLDTLPFPKTRNVDRLLKELRSKKEYDDKKFLDEYCKYDGPSVTKKLCERIILDKHVRITEKNMESNGKENVLIYVGNLAKNGITTSIKNILATIDLNERNYFLAFPSNKVEPNKDFLTNLPENVYFYPMMGRMNLSLFGKGVSYLYKKRKLPFRIFLQYMRPYYKDEIKRMFGKVAKFSNVIHFTGYEYKVQVLFSLFDCNRIIYVHNNMVGEIKAKRNQRPAALKYSYREYDKVVLVTDDLLESTAKFTRGKTSNFVVVKNLIANNEIIRLSKKPLAIDERTVMNTSLENLEAILNSNAKKFVNIGRFSVEKGQLRLIDCFVKLWRKNRKSYLIIIGGYGPIFKDLVERVEQLECSDHIILIKSLSNPYTILKRCNYFVLSSYHEGFGLVLAEADILGKPVIATDIDGPRNFMIEHGGVLVENSDNGIYEGMRAMMKNKIKPMSVDYEDYNRESIESFYSLLK